MKKLAALVGLLVLFGGGIWGCTEGDEEQAVPLAGATGSALETHENSHPDVADAQPASSIPADVEYTVIGTNNIPGVKRSIDVRLNRSVRKNVLRSIATVLKNADPAPYKRTFIPYYLPQMEVGAGAWATTHFNPELSVEILGLTVEQERAATNEPDDPRRDVNGAWLDQSPGLAGKITIYRENGGLFMERGFQDGSGGTTELIEDSGGRRFEKKGGASFGEHYFVDRQGNLQIRDEDGLIATASRLK